MSTSALYLSLFHLPDTNSMYNSHFSPGEVAHIRTCDICIDRLHSGGHSQNEWVQFTAGRQFKPYKYGVSFPPKQSGSPSVGNLFGGSLAWLSIKSRIRETVCLSLCRVKTRL